MKVKEITNDDIRKCAALLTEVYGGHPWNYQWTIPRATLYLKELYESSRFVGFVIYEGDEPLAAMFSHVKSWWINDLLVIDELFVATTKQGNGYGQALMNSAREFSKHNEIGSINLITHKYMPAMSFYEKNTFLQAEQYVLMFKEI